MLADIVDVAEDIVVPESQYGPAVLLQALGPSLIGYRQIFVAMLRAIDFNNELFLWASEIDNVASDWKLPPKA